MLIKYIIGAYYAPGKGLDGANMAEKRTERGGRKHGKETKNISK